MEHPAQYCFAQNFVINIPVCDVFFEKCAQKVVADARHCVMPVLASAPVQEGAEQENCPSKASEHTIPQCETPLLSGFGAWGSGEQRQGMRPQGDIPGEPHKYGLFHPAAC
jgi:hypothetical protein